MRFIIHAGMGKTGTSSVQAALDRSGDALAAAGIHYLGRWMTALGPKYDGFAGFEAFMALDEERMERGADRFVAHARRVGAKTGARTFIHSNEAYYRGIPFLRALAGRAEAEVVVYVRSPARWLPSAHLQWGVLHKYTLGPVPSFGENGRVLMSQYDLVRAMHQALGERLVVRPYPEGGDVIEDFSAVIGVALDPPEVRVQERPSVAEAIVRATFNGGAVGEQLPDAFDRAFGLPPWRSPLPRASDKHAHLFDQRELPAILAENRELLDYFEREFGLDMRPPTVADAPPAFEELADGLLGFLVDLTCAQARQIGKLKSRLRAVEARLQDQ